MARSSDLKKRLKAADKRRGRRPLPTAAPPRPQSRAPDVVAMLSDVILRHADTPHSEINDITVVSALRGLQRGATTNADAASSLREELEEVSRNADVDVRAFRAALSQILDLAQQHRDARNSWAFIRYLAILAN